MTTYNCYEFEVITALAANQVAELHLLSPTTRQLLLANLNDLPRASLTTHISSAWQDRLTLDSTQIKQAGQMVEIAKAELLLDPPIILQALIVIRNKLGGQDTGSNMTQVIQSIARAVGAPGPDETIETELTKIANVM